MPVFLSWHCAFLYQEKGSMNEVDVGVESRVIEIVSGYLVGVRRGVECSSRLVEDLYIDSVGVVEIVMALNEAFGIDLPDAEISKWRTVEDMCDLVKFCGKG
jgi:acyl carrier protein